MVETRSRREKIYDACNVLFLAMLALLTLYPLLYVLFASVSNPTEFMKKNFTFLLKPVGKIQFEAYRLVFNNRSIGMGFRNTLVFLFLGTSINMLLTILGAYVLSRKGYRLKRLFTLMMIFCMYFEGGLVPLFLTVQKLNIYNTYWGVILPAAISTYNMIVLRTAFASVPASLEESARIDGANDFVILFRVMLPLCVPTLAVVGLYYAVTWWNAWFYAVIFLRDRQLLPIQVILREILITSNADYLSENGRSLEMTFISEIIKYATIIVATVPILAIYPFIQRFFVKGVMLGAVKE